MPMQTLIQKPRETKLKTTKINPMTSRLSAWLSKLVQTLARDTLWGGINDFNKVMYATYGHGIEKDATLNWY